MGKVVKVVAISVDEANRPTGLSSMGEGDYIASSIIDPGVNSVVRSFEEASAGNSFPGAGGGGGDPLVNDWVYGASGRTDQTNDVVSSDIDGSAYWISAYDYSVSSWRTVRDTSTTWTGGGVADVDTAVSGPWQETYLDVKDVSSLRNRVIDYVRDGSGDIGNTSSYVRDGSGNIGNTSSFSHDNSGNIIDASNTIYTFSADMQTSTIGLSSLVDASTAILDTSVGELNVFSGSVDASTATLDANITTNRNQLDDVTTLSGDWENTATWMDVSSTKSIGGATPTLANDLNVNGMDLSGVSGILSDTSIKIESNKLDINTTAALNLVGGTFVKIEPNSAYPVYIKSERLDFVGPDATDDQGAAIYNVSSIEGRDGKLTLRTSGTGSNDLDIISQGTGKILMQAQGGNVNIKSGGAGFVNLQHTDSQTDFTSMLQVGPEGCDFRASKLMNASSLAGSAGQDFSIEGENLSISSTVGDLTLSAPNTLNLSGAGDSEGVDGVVLGGAGAITRINGDSVFINGMGAKNNTIWAQGGTSLTLSSDTSIILDSGTVTYAEDTLLQGAGGGIDIEAVKTADIGEVTSDSVKISTTLSGGPNCTVTVSGCPIPNPFMWTQMDSDGTLDTGTSYFGSGTACSVVSSTNFATQGRWDDTLKQFNVSAEGFWEVNANLFVRVGSTTTPTIAIRINDSTNPVATSPQINSAIDPIEHGMNLVKYFSAGDFIQILINDASNDVGFKNDSNILFRRLA
jgi:hypothetical protein